ncbi:MAG: VOC family protein [Chloroflexi bacterium]|nr:VOC family protein [Chloroflexota bacterium]MCI0643941.1 VOC family protein [Chloroflexota bacterium]MCI0728919.1 VOC family protein [Chloroflexota bacterium]
MVQNMTFLGLVVKDVAAATAFYQQQLGLPVNEAESIPNVYTQFDLNGGAIFGLISGFEQEGIGQSFDAALLIPDIDATYEQWKTAGVELLSEPTDMPFGRTFLFRTPDGHVLRAFRPPSRQ